MFRLCFGCVGCVRVCVCVRFGFGVWVCVCGCFSVCVLCSFGVSEHVGGRATNGRHTVVVSSGTPKTTTR